MGNESVDELFESVRAELRKALTNWPPWNSPHEGHALMLEEFEELWAHVKTRPYDRDLIAMRYEAVQVAACAVRFALELCGEERGRR